MKKDSPFAWYKKARVINVEEFHPPFTPELEIDPERLVKRIVELGADCINLTAASKHAIYATKHIPMHSQLEGRDVFGEIVAACRKQGIRVIACLATGHKLPYDILQKHQDWMWRPAPVGKAVSSQHYDCLKKRHPSHNWRPSPEAIPPLSYHTSEGLHAPLCFNSPYRESLREVVREVVTGYSLDGIYFDSWQRVYFAPFDICYCDKCRSDFRRRYGFELPLFSKRLSQRKEDVMTEWFLWYKQLSCEIGEEIVSLVKNINKDLMLLCHGEGPYGNRDRLMNHDGFLMEEYEPLAFRMQFISLMVNEDRICTPFIGRCDHLQRIVTYGKEFLLEGMATVACGATPTIANGHSFYFAGKKETACLSSLYGLMREMELQLGTAEPYPFLAISTPKITLSYSRGDAESRKATGDANATDSLRQAMLGDEIQPLRNIENNCVFWPYAREGLLEKVRTQLEGAFRIGLSCHMPVQTVPEYFLEDPELMKRYKIVYLPGTPIITKQQARAISDYVKNGGNLIVTGEASLFTKDGGRLKNFTLSKVLGINLRNSTAAEAEQLEDLRFKNGCFTDIYMKYRGKTGQQYFPLRELMPQEIMDKFIFVKPHAKTRVLADLVLGDGSVFAPGITVNQYGRGKAVYICPGYEQRYLRQRSPLVRDMFKNLFYYLAKGKPPIEVNLPDTVFALLNRYDKGWLLHLLNYTGCIQEKPFPELWPLDLPRVEWIPPHTDVRVTFNLDKNVGVQSVRSIPGQQSLRWNSSTHSVTLPELGDYACLNLVLGRKKTK